MEEMHESSSEEMNFSQEEVVWAKITGYPWWPALITANPLPGSNAFRVDFFADNTHAFVARSKLAKYQQLRGEVDLHKHMKKGLRKAIASADQAIRDRLGLTPSLPHLREAVEVIPPTQKQLLQPPFIETTPLQEKEQNPTSCLPTANSPEEPIQDSEDHAHSQEEQQPPVLQYSLEKRQKYVNYLLKKYQLNDLTHDDQRISHKHRFRNKAGRRKEKGRTKKIVKQHHEQHRPSMMFMLSRKLHRYLKQKPELCESQRKDIVLSLTKQVEAHHPRIQNAVDEVTKLLKWLQITPANTIADYYQSWSSFQTEKEKASNMTNEE